METRGDEHTLIFSPDIVHTINLNYLIFFDSVVSGGIVKAPKTDIQFRPPKNTLSLILKQSQNFQVKSLIF